MSATRKRSFSIAGHRTSVALEPAFWRELDAVAAARGISLARLIGEVDRARDGGLASALRLYVLDRLRQAHPKAGIEEKTHG